MLSSSSSSSDGNLFTFLSVGSEEREDLVSVGDGAAVTGTVLAGLILVGFATVGYLYKYQINDYLTQFSEFIEGEKFIS